MQTVGLLLEDMNAAAAGHVRAAEGQHADAVTSFMPCCLDLREKFRQLTVLQADCGYSSCQPGT